MGLIKDLKNILQIGRYAQIDSSVTRKLLKKYPYISTSEGFVFKQKAHIPWRLRIQWPKDIKKNGEILIDTYNALWVWDTRYMQFIKEILDYNLIE